jgi:hypothetical protein
MNRSDQVADDEQIDVTKTEARAGSTPGIARYVLMASLALVVIAFAVIVGIGFK